MEIKFIGQADILDVPKPAVPSIHSFVSTEEHEEKKKPYFLLLKYS